LGKGEKELPSRFFYDAAGSRLFERITRLPEYYLTRCETEILERYAGEILAVAGEEFQIVEFGAGSAEKTRLLLRGAVERQGEVQYVPIDISSEFLRGSALELLDDVKGLWVTALAGDYLDSLAYLPYEEGTRLFLFLGSTIGNFEKDEAIAFMRRVRQVMRSEDRILIGADLKKSPAIIEPAYNDSQGITAQFNKNILARINRELCGHFDLSQFEHHAPWIEDKSRIEMRLVSKKEQDVSVEGLEQSFHFAKGESIHTENSHKWSPEVFASMCQSAGLKVMQRWVDSKSCFALDLLSCSDQ
jgi:dimethylhistidine N-methyltransferase